MKKVNITTWGIVILLTSYVFFLFINSFDSNKIDSPIKDSITNISNTSSTKSFSTLFSEMLDSNLGTPTVEENATNTSSTTTENKINNKKDPNTFDFDGVFYKKNDLPLDFKKVFTPTGSIYVKIVSDGVSREKGLSGVTSMDMDVGMLFVFEKEMNLKFWMKDMNFPLDMIWMDKNYKIIDISENILPESYPNTFSPVAPAKYVLEMNAKIARKIGLEIGKRITF